MAYRFRCPEHGDDEFGAREPAPACWCGGRMVRVYVMPAISASATPTSRPDAHAALERERRWDRDISAYRRLVKSGVQPKSTEGAAKLEAKANTTTEIEAGKLLPPRLGRQVSRVREDM